MDKHVRPYVCEESGCEKLQGFMYSGGLLRHQRETHKQYGGPKTPQMCPHRDCKRSTGAGFSRDENLREHLRRIHHDIRPSDDNKSRRSNSDFEEPDFNIRRRVSRCNSSDPSLQQGIEEEAHIPPQLHLEVASKDDVRATEHITTQTLIKPPKPESFIPSAATLESITPVPGSAVYQNTEKDKTWLDIDDETDKKIDELLRRWTFLGERQLQTST